MIVSEVAPGGEADTAGIQPGDLIVNVDHKPVKSVSEFEKAVQAASTTKRALLLVKHGAYTRYVVIQMG